jgi:hypothetical protein
MDAAAILAIIKLAGEIGANIIPLFLHKDANGNTTVSVGIILKDTPQRNAETLSLIAAANAEPPKVTP